MIQNDTNFHEIDFKDMGHFWLNQNKNLDIQNTALDKENLTKPTFKDLWGYEVNWRNPEVHIGAIHKPRGQILGYF